MPDTNIFVVSKKMDELYDKQVSFFALLYFGCAHCGLPYKSRGKKVQFRARESAKELNSPVPVGPISLDGVCISLAFKLRVLR